MMGDVGCLLQQLPVAPMTGWPPNLGGNGAVYNIHCAAARYCDPAMADAGTPTQHNSYLQFHTARGDPQTPGIGRNPIHCLAIATSWNLLAPFPSSLPLTRHIQVPQLWARRQCVHWAATKRIATHVQCVQLLEAAGAEPRQRPGGQAAAAHGQGLEASQAGQACAEVGCIA